MTRDAKELKTKILEDEFSHLNPMQRQAVFATDAPLLILAGAGSGKTTVIVNKIGYLIKYGHTAEDAGTVSDEDYAFLENCLTDRSMRQSERYLSLMRSSDPRRQDTCDHVHEQGGGRDAVKDRKIRRLRTGDMGDDFPQRVRAYSANVCGQARLREEFHDI